MSQPDGNTQQLQSLLDQATAGDDQVYDQLIAVAEQRLHKLTQKMLAAYPHLRRWEQTDDVYQNAMLRLHRSLAEVKPDSVRAFVGLAATQIRRTLIDLARHHFGPEGHAAKHQSDIDAAGENKDAGFLRNAADQSDKPQTLTEWAEFHKVVESLPEDECEVFSLVWYGGITQREVAEMFEVSERTIIRKMHTARQLIYEAMQGDSPAVDRTG